MRENTEDEHTVLPLETACCVDLKRGLKELFMFNPTNYKQCKLYITADHILKIMSYGLQLRTLQKTK